VAGTFPGKVPATFFLCPWTGTRPLPRDDSSQAPWRSTAAFCLRSFASPTGTWLATPASAIVSLRCRAVFPGRERCDNRLSYSNIGDEQLTIW